MALKVSGPYNPGDGIDDGLDCYSVEILNSNTRRDCIRDCMLHISLRLIYLGVYNQSNKEYTTSAVGAGDEAISEEHYKYQSLTSR